MEKINFDNSAAVNLLIKLIEDLNIKKSLIRRYEIAEKEIDQIVLITFYLEAELLSQNIDTLRKMIESQNFNY